MSDDKTTISSAPIYDTPPPDDRRWWFAVYRAGLLADLDKLPRTPPDYLTEDQKIVWLKAYDR